MTQKAKKTLTSTAKLRDQIRKTGELYALNRINRTPVSIGNALYGNFGGSAGGIQASQGNYLQVSGGTMVGPIAYYPAVVAISSEEINIAPNTSSTPRNSSYVIVSFSSPAILSLISGASYAGQILLLQVPASSTLTIENYTSNVSGNIVTGDGNDIVINTGSDPVVIQLQFDITVSPNSNNGGWSVLYAKSISGSTATASFPLQGPVDARGLVSTTQNISLSDADGHVTTMTLDNSAAPSLSITFSNYPASGKFMEWEVWITQDSTGGVGISWPAAVVNPPTITTTANTVTAVTFHTHDNGTTVYAVVIQNAAATSGNFATRALDNLVTPVLNTHINFNSHAPTNFIGFTTPLAGQALVADGNGFTFDTPAADEYKLRIGGSDEFRVTNALVDLYSKSFTNYLGFTAAAGQAHVVDAFGMEWNLPSGDLYTFKVNGSQIAVFGAGAHALAGGSLSMTNQKITNMLDPTAAQDAATKNYVDSTSGNPLTTKGDLFGFSTLAARIPVGSDGQILTADSTTALGVKWAGASGSTSFPDDVFEIFDNTTPTKKLQFSLATFIAGTSLIGSNTLTAARTWSLPDISGSFIMNNGSQTITGLKTFENGNLLLRNPADTFSYALAHGAITADRILNLPVITATDTLATLGLSQTFTGPTIAFAGTSFSVTSGTIVLGDTSSDTLTVVATSAFSNDVTFGSTNADVVVFVSKINSNMGIVGGNVIKSNDTTEIGFQVTNGSLSVGSVGSIILPISSTVTTSKSTLDGLYGNLPGAAGILDSGSGSLTLWVRQSNGNWAAVNLARDQGT